MRQFFIFINVIVTSVQLCLHFLHNYRTLKISMHKDSGKCFFSTHFTSPSSFNTTILFSTMNNINNYATNDGINMSSSQASSTSLLPYTPPSAPAAPKKPHTHHGQKRFPHRTTIDEAIYGKLYILESITQQIKAYRNSFIPRKRFVPSSQRFLSKLSPF